VSVLLFHIWAVLPEINVMKKMLFDRPIV